MKSLFCAAAALILAHVSCEAAPIWNCGGAKKPEAASPCADPEIVRLDKAIDARLGRLIAAADPVTALLLKRDQRWFVEAAIEGSPSDLQLREDAERESLRTKLGARLKTLEAMQPKANGPSGEWANAFLTVKVTKTADDTLQVEIAGNVKYAGLDEPAECKLKAAVKPSADGWFTGAPARLDGKPMEASKDEPAALRMRLQAGTLRVVLVEGERTDFCTAPEFITGTYFATGAPSSGAAQAVAPSFDCRTAKNEDEEEICADPELAQRDVEIAKLYRDALKRLDAKAQGYLREDQRGWAKIKNDMYRFHVHPGWDKRHYMVHHIGNARASLTLSQTERIGMLRSLDETRKGFLGRWAAYNAEATIAPKKDTADGTLSIVGSKWDGLDYKAGCEFDAEGKASGNAFKSDGEPRFARDGITLTVDARYPDKPRTKGMELKMERPDYCRRLDSAKARLFPVKDDVKVKEGR